MRQKAAVIGAGNVGASLALYIAEADLCDVVLFDIVEDMPAGKALDLSEAGPVRGYSSRVTGTNDYKDIESSDVVVVTAGFPRKPGMSREDLLQKNASIIGEVTENIVTYAPEAFIIIVSNPLDIMTYHALKKSGFPKNRVMGQAGVLDSIRFRTFLSMELNISPQIIQTMVMGGHGDTMVPLPRYTTISGVPISEFLSQNKIDELVERTRKGGGEIVKLLKTGSAYYAPAAAATEMVKAILRDDKKVLPASVLLEGEYGLSDLCIGVPIVLGDNGVEKVLEITLTDEERKMLHDSAETYREFLKIIGY
jgi:malate dehydrogenase